jgi:hypothetical protein
LFVPQRPVKSPQVGRQSAADRTLGESLNSIPTPACVCQAPIKSHKERVPCSRGQYGIAWEQNQLLINDVLDIVYQYRYTVYQ